MFSLVLYNGEDKWTAPDNIDQLIETEVDLGQYGLHFEHFVIAENAYGKEWLAKIDNIIAALFFAQIEEQDLTREEVKSMLIKVLERERETIRQEGFDSGKKEGIQEGIQERNRQIVQAMVVKGFPLPTIAALLNLSLPEVELLSVATSPTAPVEGE